MMSFSLSLSVLSSLSSASSSSAAATSSAALFLLSTVLIGHVTGTPKGYDYDYGFDDGSYDPNYGHNVIKVNKVVDYYSKPQYAFGYEVDDYYNQLSHGRWEIRDGDVVQGQYRVLLPDGRIQIVSYIADKFGYRPTVEYIGKGAHPPPPPAYANIKPVAAYPLIAASPAPALVSVSPLPAVYPSALPLGLHHGGGGGHFSDEYNPIKIKLNSYPINGPLPVVDPYAAGYGGGYGLDPAFAGSTNVNKISRKRALLYDRTLFRKDVEKRTPTIKRIVVKRKRMVNHSQILANRKNTTTTTSTTSTTTTAPPV